MIKKLIGPTKVPIVHTMQVMDDLNKTILGKRVVAQRHEHSFPLFAEPLQDINQPSDRWEGQLIINTLQGRYQARLKPPSRLHQRLEEITSKHTYIKIEPQKGWGKKNTLNTLFSLFSFVDLSDFGIGDLFAGTTPANYIISFIHELQKTGLVRAGFHLDDHNILTISSSSEAITDIN